MPLAVTCPNGHALNLDPKYSGKRIRCNKCQAIFLVDGEAVTASAPASKPPPPPAENDFDDDELDDEDRPRKRRRDEQDEDDDDRPRKRRRDEEDEDEDDRPRKRRRRDEEDEDEDDDDRPRSRRRRDEDDEDDEDDDRPRGRRRRDEEDDDDDDDDDDDRGGRSRDSGKLKREQMRSVASGLSMFGWKFTMLAVCCGGVVAAVIMALLAGLAPRMATAFGIISMIFLIVILLCYLAALVLGIIGACMILKIPPKSGIRGLAIANLACEGAYALLLLIYIIMSLSMGFALANMMGGPGGAGGFAAGMHGGILVVLLLMALVGLAGFVVFMILLRLTGFYVKAKRAAKTAIVLMIVAIATPIGGSILAISIVAIAARAGPAVAIIGLAIYIAIFAAMAFVMFRIRGACVEIGDKARP